MLCSLPYLAASNHLHNQPSFKISNTITAKQEGAKMGMDMSRSGSIERVCTHCASSRQKSPERVVHRVKAASVHERCTVMSAHALPCSLMTEAAAVKSPDVTAYASSQLSLVRVTVLVAAAAASVDCSCASALAACTLWTDSASSGPDFVCPCA